MDDRANGISVVIPAFNAAQFLPEAIASVRRQTIRVREIIVVDDGSRDGTHLVASRAGAQVMRQPNRGPAAARNAGIHRATGRWIAFLDADDVWDPDKLEKQMLLAGTFRDVPVISCDRRTVRLKTDSTGNARIIEASHFETLDGYRRLVRRRKAMNSYLGRVTEDFVRSGCVLLPSTLLVRRSVFASVGLFARRLRGYEDYEFLLRVLAVHPLGIVEQPLVTYRLHAANLHEDLDVMWVNARRFERLVRANPMHYPPGSLSALAWVSYLPLSAAAVRQATSTST